MMQIHQKHPGYVDDPNLLCLTSCTWAQGSPRAGSKIMRNLECYHKYDPLLYDWLMVRWIHRLIARSMNRVSEFHRLSKQVSERAIERMSVVGWLTEWVTDWRQAGWPNDDWLTGWLTHWLTRWLAGWLADSMDWLVGWWVGWFISLLIDWLTDWLIDWLIDFFIIDYTSQH